MNTIDQVIAQQNRAPSNSVFGFLSTIAIFMAIGATQLNLDYAPPTDPEFIDEVYLPPPAPPPAKADQPEVQEVDFDYAIDIDPSPFEISLDFLKVKVGVDKELVNEVNFDVEAAIADFRTDGLDSLRVYERDEVDSPPSLTNPYIPRPPKSLRHLDIEAIVHFRLTPDGTAENVSVLHCNVPEAVSIVKEAILRSEFRPAIKDNQPVHCWVRQPVKIRGQKKKFDPFLTR